MSSALGAAVEGVVSGLPESRHEAVAGIVTWSRGEEPFAALLESGIEIRLDRPIAAAATRTPDTAPSGRGPEWIRFNPRELDPHALDRLRAWLELGYRRAGDEARSGGPARGSGPRPGGGHARRD